MIHKFLLILLLFPLLLRADDSDKAYAKYREGELASNALNRKEAFNEALTMYLHMETERPSAILCLNIANTYYQLNEYGYAVLYYYKALKENPRLDEANTNLQIALNKVGMTRDTPNVVQNYLLFLHYKLSHNEKALTVLLLLFIAFALLSVNLWLPQMVLKKVAFIALWGALIFFTSIIWADYFTMPEAVVVRPVALRRDAGDQYAPVVGMPVLPGTKLQVLSIPADGNWLKVRSNTSEDGYISKEYARII
ncbi:MAG: hypothetical protein LLF94_01160 [Chlamydiales bacterium]|nr:hypothetical protein [Chlamydiales bacterium]